MRYLLILLVSLPAFADIDWIKKPLEDISTFLNLQGKAEQVWVGQNVKGGGVCSLTITKTDSALVFSPSLPGAPKAGEVPTDLRKAVAFVALKDSTDIDGGREGDHLWTSYFLDDIKDHPSMFPVLHGQFGLSFSLDLKLDKKGNLSYFRFSKSKHQDLGFESLGRVECASLKLVQP